MENNTEILNEFQKAYDHAYYQGVSHALKLCEVCAEADRPLSYAIEKVKELLTDKTPTPTP